MNGPVFEMREVYDLDGRLIASCTTTEATRAAMRLLSEPASGARMTVTRVDREAGVITFRGEVS